MKFLLAIAMVLISINYSFSQFAGTPVEEWVKKLSEREDKKNESIQSLFSSVMYKTDTLKLNVFLKQLEANGISNNIYFTTRLNVIRLGLLQYKDHLRSDRASKLPVLNLMKLAMQQASESNDEYLIAFVSKLYFSIASFYNETELSIMYSLYSIELYEKLFGTGSYPDYHFAAEQMYRVKEYEKSKNYSLKWLNMTANTTNQGYKDYRLAVYNTLGLAYHRTGQYDSAMYYYKKAMAETEINNRPGWKGIVSGNMGQVFYLKKQYDTAIALLDIDYRSSMKYQYYDNVVNALQWSARAYAAKGNGDKAMQQFRAAMQLLDKVPEQAYRQNVYYAGVEVFEANGLMDSAMYYSGLYQKLHDSIEKRIATSSLAISNLRLSEEKNLYNILRLQQDKKAQKQQRNFIILGIVLMAVISLLFVNRQRLLLKYRHDSLEKEKEIMETEMVAARQQMELFTQNIIEKTSLIEKLEQQMKDNNSSAGQQDTIAALSSLTILTEADWGKFKQLFEKMNPMFFQRLKTKVPDITAAEQRMAALTSLQLTTRQMASMQGISPDSVHKTRQRLRLRLGVSNETNLEEFLGTV